MMRTCRLLSIHVTRREKPKGIRMGFMGHLTYLSDEICKFLEKHLDHLEESIKGILNDSSANLKGISILKNGNHT